MKSPRHATTHPALLLFAGFVAGGVAMAVLGPQPEDSVIRMTLPPEMRPLPRPAPSASEMLPPPDPEPEPERGLVGAASAGHLDALKTLEERAEADRTAEEATAIAEGRTELSRRDLLALKAAIDRAPELAHDRSALSRLFDFIEREPVAIEALTTVASLPGPESTDLLDAEWQARKSTIVGLLARDLSRGPARAQASEALSIKLDLETLTEAHPADDARALTRCERARSLFGRVETHGDRRLAPLFGRLDERTGCGSNRKADCYACLRDDPRVAAGRAAAMEREVETPWILRRR